MKDLTAGSDEMNKTEVLQSSSLFAGLLPEEVEMLADLTQLRSFEPGETVFEQGDVGDSLYLLMEGSVDVVRRREDGSEHIIAVLNAKDFFGEMALIDKEFRSASIKAKTKVDMLCLTNENLHSFARVYKNGFTLVVINIARVLSIRLRETNEKLADKM